MKLKASQEVCNDTMKALWEECKPCLKQTCMKFYARVCRSGSGLVGRQVKRKKIVLEYSLASEWENEENEIFLSFCTQSHVCVGFSHTTQFYDTSRTSHSLTQF